MRGLHAVRVNDQYRMVFQDAMDFGMRVSEPDSSTSQEAIAIPFATMLAGRRTSTNPP
jgi:hypothetical protein